MGIPITHRRPHVTGQRVAHAPAGAETGRTATDTLSRPAPYLRDHGTAKRCGRKNGVLDAGPLLGGLHAGYIRPRYHGRAAQSGANDGQYPIPCCLTVSATRSRWGLRIHIEMWRSNKLGIKEKISRGKFPRLIFSCPVPSGLPHRSHCVPMNMTPSNLGYFRPLSPYRSGAGLRDTRSPAPGNLCMPKPPSFKRESSRSKYPKI